MYRQPTRTMLPVTYATRGGRRVARRLAQRVPARVAPHLLGGGVYLGEDEHYYYWMEPGATNQLGGFFDNIGNMFKRMVKFTPKSFTPGNIYKGFINTTLTVATGGAYQLLPKNIKKTVYDVGKYAVPVVAGGVLAYTAGPAVWGILQPKLAAAGKLLSSGATKIFGGGKPETDIGPGDYGSAVTRAGTSQGPGFIDKAMTIGGELYNLLGKLPQHRQAEVAEKLTPQDIAYMEQYQQIPPHLRGYFDNMAQQTFNPEGSSGAASLYSPVGPMEQPQEGNPFAGFDMSTLLMIGIPVAFVAFMGTGSRK